MFEAIGMVKPGLHLGDLGHAIQTRAESQGYSIVREYYGHGTGLEFHEGPRVAHYGWKGWGVKLEAGMTFTIEPMINLGLKSTKKMG